MAAVELAHVYASITARSGRLGKNLLARSPSRSTEPSSSWTQACPRPLPLHQPATLINSVADIIDRLVCSRASLFRSMP